MIKIIDQFLSHSYFRHLQNYFLTRECVWHMNDAMTGDDSFKILGSFGFDIPIYDMSSSKRQYGFESNDINSLVKALVFNSQDKVREINNSLEEVIRVRADMTVYNPSKHRHELHTDYTHDHTTAIFYMNTSDGNTLIYDKNGKSLLKEVEPIENRLIIFDGILQHTGHSPSGHKSRVILNMNFMNPDLIKILNKNNMRRNDEL